MQRRLAMIPCATRRINLSSARSFNVVDRLGVFSLSHMTPQYSHRFSTMTNSHLITTTVKPSRGVSNDDDDSEISNALVASYASRESRSVSLQEMITAGSNPAYLVTAASWLWKEIPVRLAKRLNSLNEAPFGLSRTPDVKRLALLYRRSLREALNAVEPTNTALEEEFTNMLRNILIRHEAVAIDLASGENLRALEATHNNGQYTTSALTRHFILQDWLDRFNGMRVGSRLLMSHHVALHNPPKPDWVGVVQLSIDPDVIVAQAIEDASAVVRVQLGEAPCVLVKRVCHAHRATAAGRIKSFHYVPAHLRAMLFELLKNAMHATVTFARRQRQARITEDERDECRLPPISMVIVDSVDDVVVRLSDRGGGIPRNKMPQLFNYYNHDKKGQTRTNDLKAVIDAREKTRKVCSNGSSVSIATVSDSSFLTGSGCEPTLNTVLHDYGDVFGLPTARLYARCLGGDLQLHSVSGYGTDAFLYLAKPQGNFKDTQT